jgi:hypothetical protein
MTAALRRIEPSGFCVGSLERCSLDGAVFVPVPERDLARDAKAEAKSGTGVERDPLASAIAEAAERGLRDVAAL